MSYRNKINVNPDVVVQGLQGEILANQHDLQKIQIENLELNNAWFVRELTLITNDSDINAGANIGVNAIHTLYMHPTQEISFFGGVSNSAVDVFIDVSIDGTNWYDSNVVITKNSSNDFNVNYRSQARYVRLRFDNTGSSTYVIERAYASYKFLRWKDTDGTTTNLDANASYVTL